MGQNIRNRLTKKAAFAAGVLSCLLQAGLFRYSFNLINGNELFFGIFFFLWFTGYASGLAFYNRRVRLYALLCLVLLAGILWFTAGEALFLMQLRRFAEDPSILQSIAIMAFLVYVPAFCLGSFLRWIFAKSRKGNVVYAFDALGFAAAAVVFALLNTVLGLTAFAGLCIVSIGLVLALWQKRQWRRITIVLFIAIAAAIAVLGMMREKTGAKIILDRETPYGRFLVMNNAGERALFQNGRAIASVPDMLFAKSVLLPFLASTGPVEKMVVIGDIGYGLERLLDAEGIDAKFINPLEQRPLICDEDKRVFLQNRYIAKYIQGERPSHILFLMPMQGTFQGMFYYSEAFLTAVGDALGEKGSALIYCGIANETYMDPLARSAVSVIDGRLRRLFDFVVFTPANGGVFIASNAPIATDSKTIAEWAAGHEGLVAGFGVRRIMDMLAYAVLEEGLPLGRNDRGIDAPNPAAAVIIGDFAKKNRFVAKALSYSVGKKGRHIVVAGFCILLLSFVLTSRRLGIIAVMSFLQTAFYLFLCVIYQYNVGTIYLDIVLLSASALLGLAYGASRLALRLLPAVAAALMVSILFLSAGHTGFPSIAFAVFTAAALYGFFIQNQMKRESPSAVYAMDLLGAGIAALFTVFFLLWIL